MNLIQLIDNSPLPELNNTEKLYLNNLLYSIIENNKLETHIQMIDVDELENPEKNILILGDFFFSGFGLDIELNLAKKLRGHFDNNKVEFINSSNSNLTTLEGVVIVENLKEELDTVILCLGSNDVLQGKNPKKIFSNLDKIIKTLLERKISIIFVKLPILPSFGQEYKKQIESVNHNIINNHNLQLFTSFNELLNNNHLQDDGLHPNAQASELIQEKLIPLLNINLKI
ncbi:hypothetical protein CPAV1605_258 [seawater metagenome]|uniref:SGNH hydrolase-type esterase domain-containing protein n=1 Tax=seawater metagenome TaxID=1561972 RepID=A0A5E8CGI0_9ZZZZ